MMKGEGKKIKKRVFVLLLGVVLIVCIIILCIPRTTPRIGSIITFGSYHSSYRHLRITPESVEKVPVRWRVLAVENGKALLISNQIIDFQVYHEEYESVTWETCSLREWLNNDFFHKAFSQEEQNLIVPTSLHHPDNTRYNTTGGRDTTDRIFLLSMEEAQNYFMLFGRRARIVASLRQYYSRRNANWWLRTPGGRHVTATVVSSLGIIDAPGLEVNTSLGIRPAFWLDLEP
ncbi:MAG: DUF6273 domain-containing protein [Clostridia bacterium]